MTRQLDTAGRVVLSLTSPLQPFSTVTDTYGFYAADQPCLEHSAPEGFQFQAYPRVPIDVLRIIETRKPSHYNKVTALQEGSWYLLNFIYIKKRK